MKEVEHLKNLEGLLEIKATVEWKNSKERLEQNRKKFLFSDLADTSLLWIKMSRWASKGAGGRGQAESGARKALSPGSQLGWETGWSVWCQAVKQGCGSAQDGPRLDQEVFSGNLRVVAEEGACPGVFIYFFSFHRFIFLSLYWICYIIASVLCFVFLAMRHVGS